MVLDVQNIVWITSFHFRHNLWHFCTSKHIGFKCAHAHMQLNINFRKKDVDVQRLIQFPVD